MEWLEDTIREQRVYLGEILEYPLRHLSQICSRHWQDQQGLDNSLKEYLVTSSKHRCRLLYAIDDNGIQFSSNISDKYIDSSIVGQDLSGRPYLDKLADHAEGAFFLSDVYSDVYVDKRTNQPCITAVHQVDSVGGKLGYIAADFGLKDLPLKSIMNEDSGQWRQIKGDPSIRGTLFQQTRTVSAMDLHIDEVMSVIESLICEQGIFHAKLHFSSSRATLWPYDDPYRYRIHVLDEIIDPEVCLAYPKSTYPQGAVVSMEKVGPVLKVFKELRKADETIYLRAASINVMNGLVGLNFSCDGSHYMAVDEFLNKDMDFWFGTSASCDI